MVLVLPYCRRFFAWVDSGLHACLSGGEAPGCRDLAVAVDGDDQKCAGGIVRRDLSDLAVRPESVGIHIVPDRNSDHISECLRGTTCRKPGDAGGRNSLSAAMAQRFRYIELPKLRPFLLSACRVTTGMAWKAGIAAEIIGVPNGSIGKMLYTAKIYLDTDDLLAWTVIIVVISVVAEKVFLAGLSRLLNPCSRFMEDTDAGY